MLSYRNKNERELNKSMFPWRNTLLHQYSCPGKPLISGQGGLLGHSFREVTSANLQIDLLSSVFTMGDIPKISASISIHPSHNTLYFPRESWSLITAPVQINSHQLWRILLAQRVQDPSLTLLTQVLLVVNRAPFSLLSRGASKGKECHLPKRDRLLLQAGVTCAVSVQLAPS